MSIGEILRRNFRPTAGTVIVPATVTTLSDAVVLDTTLRRSHNDDAEVMTMPVEASVSFATDNVRRTPTTLVVAGVLTDAPLLPLAGVLVSPNRAQDNYNRLLRFEADGELLVVTTDVRTHRNVLIRSVGVDEDASTGDALFVTLGFVQAQILNLKTQPVQFDIHALVAGAGGTPDMGLQSLVPGG